MTLSPVIGMDGDLVDEGPGRPLGADHDADGIGAGKAHAYGAFATGGRELGLRQETLDLLAAPAIPPARGFYDECLKGDVQFSLGFMKPSIAGRVLRPPFSKRSKGATLCHRPGT